MTKPKKLHPYYNFTKLFSYNATYNFLVGGRGLGKTYGAVKKCIKDFIKSGSQFVYLRRYKSELSAAKMSFFTAVESEFRDYDFRVQGNLGQIAHASTRSDKRREWSTICFFIALSTAQSQKSVNYTNVKAIIYDEFILETSNQSYLKNEATVFNNFYSTVDRWQDKTRVLFLANSVSISNPYFLEYDIVPDVEMSEFVVKAGGFILCHFPDSKEFQTSVYATAFGKFIANTEYAKYSVGNQFSDQSGRLIEGRTSRANYMFNLETSTGTFSIWHDPLMRKYFIERKLPKGGVTYTLIPENVEEEKQLLFNNDVPIKQLRTAYRQARVYFDDDNVRNAFIEVFRR